MSIIRDTEIEWIKKTLKPYEGICPHKCNWKYEGKDVSCWVEPIRRFNQPSLNGQPRPVEDFENRLRAELEKAKEPHPILLSNTTDCYQPIETKYRLTRKAITMLLEYKWTPVILTKSTEFLIDTDTFTPDTWMGVTLTSPEWAKKYENASPFIDRTRALKYIAENSRAKRWISWEPFDPIGSMPLVNRVLEETKPNFVVFGTLNQDRPKKPVADYRQITLELFDLMTNNYPDIPFYFKKEMLGQLPEEKAREISVHHSVPWYKKGGN